MRSCALHPRRGAFESVYFARKRLLRESPNRPSIIQISPIFSMFKNHLTTPLTVFVFSAMSFLVGSSYAQVAPPVPKAHLETPRENGAGLVPSQPGAQNVNLSSSLAACAVTPLPMITDDEALSFEKGTSPDTVGLKPAMAGALEKFQQLVRSVGGTFSLKSAYRPLSYQAHLQAVWFKWMLELRNNGEPACQTLRTQVGEEFARHRLLETQKPVTSSDHTRGLAFDATVVMPPVARLKRRRVSLDRLALLAGIKRPDILRDPVHFKLANGSRSRSA
jgi:hypothetical protein